MKNFKDIEREIDGHFSKVRKAHGEAKMMIKTTVERLEETHKEIAELEKKRDELKTKLEARNVNK